MEICTQTILGRWFRNHKNPSTRLDGAKTQTLNDEIEINCWRNHFKKLTSWKNQWKNAGAAFSCLLMAFSVLWWRSLLPGRNVAVAARLVILWWYPKISIYIYIHTLLAVRSHILIFLTFVIFLCFFVYLLKFFENYFRSMSSEDLIID